VKLELTEIANALNEARAKGKDRKAKASAKGETEE